MARRSSKLKSILTLTSVSKAATSLSLRLQGAWEISRPSRGHSNQLGGHSKEISNTFQDKNDSATTFQEQHKQRNEFQELAESKNLAQSARSKVIKIANDAQARSRAAGTEQGNKNLPTSLKHRGAQTTLGGAHGN